MDPRGSSEAAEGVAADLAAASRSQHMITFAQKERRERGATCRCCQGPCRNLGRERAVSMREGTGKGGKPDIIREKKQNLHRNKGDSVYEDDIAEYGSEQWDGQGRDHIQGENNDGEGVRLIRGGNDGVKFVDASTPTLIDEDDFYEDEEMVKLEYERIRRNATAPIGSYSRRTTTSEEEAVRRTPGAQMYRSNYEASTPGAERSSSFDRDSMRRTPGASKMHASALAIGGVSPTKLPQDHSTRSDTRGSSAYTSSTDSSGLGFGLTLSTPIAAGEKHVGERRSPRALNVKDTSSGRSSGATATSLWSKDSQRGRGAYSPNTLRLAADMGNLLLEDDDNTDETQKISQFVFRNDGGSSEGSGLSESWTTPFIVNMEQNQHQNTSRVPRNTHGRGRKSRLERERVGRSRGGGDRMASSTLSSFSHSSTPWNPQQRPGGNSFLPNAHQPTPVRKVQPNAFGVQNSGNRSLKTFYDTSQLDAPFLRGMAGQDSSFVDYRGQQHAHGNLNAPTLNFGGAFSPPAKVSGTPPSIVAQQQQQQQRSFAPPPMTGSFFGSNSHGNAGFESPLQFSPFPTGSPAFGASFVNQAQRHQVSPPPYFHGSPVFGHSSTFQTVVPQHSHCQIIPPSTSPRPIRHSPTFNFPLHHNSAYQMNSPTHHQHSLPQDYMVNVNVPHAQPQPTQQQPTQFISSPQSWAANAPAQYEGMHHPQSLEQQYNSHPPSAYTNHGGWQMQPYGMHPGHPQVTRESQAGPLFAPASQTWNGSEGDQQVARMESSQQGSAALNAGNNQHRATFAQPIGMSAGRPPSRGKNQRKIKKISKKWKQNQQQKNENPNSNIEKASQKVDSGPSVAGSAQGSASTTGTGKKSSINTKGGKKKHRDRNTPTQPERPLSTPVEEIAANQSSAGSSTPATETIEDPAEAKRAELTESPATRSAFKDFYRKLRAEERNSFQDAEKFAMLSLKDGSLPETIHWRVYLELADLAKRSNRFEEARKLYQEVYKLQPYASQGWLEYSKLEEECGNMDACAKILATGLEYCEYSENLLTRAIKHEEKRGNLARAREFLSRLKHVGIEKVWRTVLEGAMLEARAGNHVMARRVLKYLMHHVPWYGPLYLEAYKLEKDLGRSKDALAVVERGLAAIPRYGPLWFGAFRLCEELDLDEKAYSLPQSMAMIDRATLSISKELIWKVHLEAAQMLERSSIENLDSTTDPTFLQVMEMSRKRFALTVMSCPPNLRWKVWLAAGRMEVAAGNADIARRLFLRAHRVVPDKGRAVALLECARLEEFVGDVDLASAILCRSRNVGSSDWKVWLESVMLAIRNGNYPKAIALSQKALQQHSGTGRLWASLIQLRHLADVEEAQSESLALALNAVPKSGEVWCEGARIHLNPFSRTFDPQRASRHLFFATKFTPQYGDGFLETLRLLILDQLLAPISTLIWEESKDQLKIDEDEKWEVGFTKYIFDILRELNSVRESMTNEAKCDLEKITTKSRLGRSSTEAVIERLHSGTSLQFIDVSRLELRCANADPNYGPLWFHCRSGPTETARTVLARAVNLIVEEVKTHAHLYIVASVRRLAVISRFMDREKPSLKEGTSAWEKIVDQELLAAPPLKHIVEQGAEKIKEEVEISERSISASNFIAGIAELSQHHPIQNLSLPERRKMLFGADSLFS